MPRPVWGGAISFGLVNVPVRLYSTVRNRDVRFHQLRKSDGCRINFKRVCQTDGQEVPPEKIAKGYEFSPDQYVMIKPEELEAIYPRKTKAIEIEDFVDLAQIDPVHFENTFYVVPEPGAAKSYSLLVAAMKQTGKVGVAKVVMRQKEYLAALRPIGQALGLATMYFQDEIISQDQFKDLLPEEQQPDKKELAMALELIDKMTRPFDPGKYKDRYQERLLEYLEEKAEGETVETRPSAKTEGAKVIDLMAALEASLKAAKKDTPPSKPKRKKASGH